MKRLLDDARAGRSRAAVLLGEVGIGKTALLEYAADQADDMLVVRGAGVETEAELAFAGLHMVLGSHADRADTLPSPQATALRAAFGMASSPGDTDRFLVGLATLSLLAELADDRPVLCLTDDAQWLDRASADALLFAARRLSAESICIVFAARDGHDFAARGLQELRLQRLEAEAAAALLEHRAADLIPTVRDRILVEARGNPLALLELPKALSPEQRSGEIAAPSPSLVPFEAVTGRVEQSFIDRVSQLPDASRGLLLVLAADDTGDLNPILAAATGFAATAEDLTPAESAGLVRVGNGRVEFAHPLIRSAIYRAAAFAQRAAAHRSLAQAYGSAGSDERRAWHLAAAASGTDETVAADLERAAEEARNRGGYSAVAATYQRAAELTPDPGERTRRTAEAASAAALAGRPQLAHRLTEGAIRYADDPLVRAKLVHVRASISIQQELPVSASELAEAAGTIADREPETAALMLFDALMAMLSANQHEPIVELAKRATALRSASPALTAVVSVLAGLASGETRQGMDALRDALRHHAWGPPERLRERVSLQAGYLPLGDVDGAYASATTLVRDCRSAGAVGMLPRMLMMQGRACFLLGRYTEVRSTAAEGLRIAEETSQPHFTGHLTGLLALVTAIEGDDEQCLMLTKQVLGADVPERGVECLQALSLLDLLRGRYDLAFTRLEEIARGPVRNLVLTPCSAPSYIEAAVRMGRADRGAQLCTGLEICADATRQPWQEAVALRCRALVVDEHQAEALFAQAVHRHGQGGPPFERARTELLYGEWLRRRRRLSAARPVLCSALEIFDTLGAVPWAARARAELRAAGQTPEPSPHAPIAQPLVSGLTPQELQVVRLAADGLSNRDIGARLFLSPRTVGYHLSKAYYKLGISSRHELRRMIRDITT